MSTCAKHISVWVGYKSTGYIHTFPAMACYFEHVRWMEFYESINRYLQKAGVNQTAFHFFGLPCCCWGEFGLN